MRSRALQTAMQVTEGDWIHDNCIVQLGAPLSRNHADHRRFHFPHSAAPLLTAASRPASSALNSTVAALRSSGPSRRLRLEHARPSDSRTVGHPTISTSRSRSATRRRTRASCWKSFSPKNARHRPLSDSSLVTTVATPVKWPGREAPSRRSARGSGSTLVSGSPGVHLLRRRREQQSDANRLSHRDVLVQVGRVLR